MILTFIMKRSAALTFGPILAHLFANFRALSSSAILNELFLVINFI